MAVACEGIIGVVKIENQDGGNWRIQRGITVDQIQQLVSFSHQDEQVMANTSDRSRFETIDKVGEWMKKRTVYTLADNQDRLLGVIWFGRKPFPESRILSSPVVPGEYKVTLALRIYGDARGKHLAMKFLQPVMSNYLGQPENKDIEGIWFETSATNLPIQTTFRKLWFVVVSQPNENGKILMAARRYVIEQRLTEVQG